MNLNIFLMNLQLPSCELRHNLQFDSIPRDFDCQQIRSYKTTAMILFDHNVSNHSYSCKHH